MISWQLDVAGSPNFFEDQSSGGATAHSSFLIHAKSTADRGRPRIPAYGRGDDGLEDIFGGRGVPAVTQDGVVSRTQRSELGFTRFK